MKLFTKEIDKKLFDQYSKGNNLEKQMVVAKIFNPYGRGTWYILNSDPEDSDYLWAIVDLFEVEIGSVLRSELESIKVPPFRLGLERDTSFRPINAKELYEGLRNGKHYAHGGSIEDENREMVLNENNQIIHHTKELPSAIKGKRVPAWVVTKVHESASDLSDATHYMDGQKMAKGGEFPNKYLELESINREINSLEQQIESDYRNEEIDEYTEKCEVELDDLKSRKETLLMGNYEYAKGGGVEGVDLSKYEDIETLEYLYKLDNKWYASGFKMKHNAIGVGYTKAKALEDLDNHLSYVTSERYAKGGGIGTLSSSETNPKEYIKKLGFDLVGKTNYSTSENGINYYVGTKKEKAIVVAFIEDEDNYMIDKKDAREMSLSAKIKGIEIVELYTNYGIELRSSEKAKDIGFDKIYKIQLEDKFSEGGAVGNEIDFEYEYAGKSKLKASGEILSKNGDYYKVKITKGLMKGKTTDVHKSMIINKMAYGGEIDTNVEMIEDKDGSQYLFPKNSKNKTLGVKFDKGGDIESLNAPNSYLNIFTLGVKLPSQEKIVSSSMSPSHFSRKSLTLTLKGGSKEVIPEAKISDFLKGKQIDLRDTNGESYAIQLNRLKEMAKGGKVKFDKTLISSLPKNRRADKNYTHFAVGKSDNKILNGWDYSDFDNEDLNAFKKSYFYDDMTDMEYNKSEYTIKKVKTLISEGINPFDYDNWRKLDFSNDKPYVQDKMAKGGTLSKSQLKHFKEWMEDGNVSKNNDGTYSTQDAQYRNKLKDLNELKKYFKREFAVDEYANGGNVGKYYEVEYEINGKKHKSTYMLYPSDKVEKMLPPVAKIISIKETNKKAKGGNVNKVAKVMHEFKEGNLHSGKSEKIVTNPKQAIAIALSEAKNNSEKKGWKHKK